MHTVFLSQVQLFQGLTHPTAVTGNLKVGNVDIAIQQLSFIERTLLAMHLCLDVSEA